MKPSLLLLTCLLTGFFSTGQVKPLLSYQFSFDTSAALLHVQLYMQGTDSGKTYIRIPGTFGSQNDLHKAIQSLKVETSGTTLHATGDSMSRFITHKPGAALHLSYTLKQDWSGEMVYPMNFRAVLQKQFMQATGFALLVIPKMDSAAVVRVQLDWKDMPRNWQIANSLHAESRTYRGELKLTDFHNTFYTAGDFRLTRHKVSGKSVYVGIKDAGWQFTDAEIGKEITRIIGMQRQFWNDNSEDYYFVSLIPFAGKGSHNGSALHQSFMLAAAKDFAVGMPVYHLLAHEYFHRWNGIMISLKGNEQENAWLGEGFTEYYTYKLLYKSGIISLQDYIKATNHSISDYYLSPVRNASIAELGKNYWSNLNYNYLPYRKGFVYALFLDYLIQSTSGGSKSLDNIMFDLRNAAQQQLPITEALFLDLIKRYTDMDISMQHRDYISHGKTIPVHEQSLGNAAARRMVVLGAFDIGFDLDGSWQSKEIKDVKENSEAWKQGIRNGMKIKGYNISYNDIEKPAEIKIEENGVIRKISYLPMAAKQIEVPQFFVKE